MDSTDEEMDMNSAEEEMESNSGDEQMETILIDEEIDFAAVNEELSKTTSDEKIEIPFDGEPEPESDLLKRYPHDLLLYQNSLIGEMELDELEKLGLERLQVLRIIDIMMKESLIKSEDFRECLLGKLKNKGFDSYVKLITSPGCDSNTPEDLEARRRDHVSHAILKVALHRKTNIFHWFIQMENILLRMRFDSLNENGFKKFLIFNDFNFPILSNEEKNEYREELTSVHEDIDLNKTDFYKVPYLRVRNLVRFRKVFFKAAVAFLPSTQIIELVSQTFKDSFSAERGYLRDVMEENPRLTPIFQKFFVTSQKPLPGEINSFDIKNIDEIAQTSFPLCMKTMHEALRENHHLKNHGRFQYALFLKLIGVDFDSAVDFWKEEFLQRMDLATFSKKYLYNVKYVYGKVGQKPNYKTYSCSSVIKSHVGYGQYHGCPYKNMTKDTLNVKLKKLGVTDQGLVEIEDLVKNELYRDACTKCFYQVHHVNLPTLIESPSGYYINSQNEILRKKHIKIRMENSLLEQTQAKENSCLDSNETVTESMEVNKENLNSSGNFNKSATEQMEVNEKNSNPGGK